MRNKTFEGTMHKMWNQFRAIGQNSAKFHAKLNNLWVKTI